MGDHFVFLVDRLLTESTLEAAIESRNQLKQFVESDTEDTVIDCSFEKDPGAILSPRKLVECRICQDEDFDSKMESPCSCSGSLKYAHRRCVQRWCNEKGDTVCEICHQQFKPGYKAPPPIFRLGGIPVNFRGNWGVARRDLNNPHFVATISNDSNLLDHDDEYDISASRSMICCRTVAVIFMILLVLRHTLPIIINRTGHYSLPLMMLLLLRITGIVLPVYIILKAVSSCLRRRQQQAAILPNPLSSEEAGPVSEDQQSHVIHVQ